MFIWSMDTLESLLTSPILVVCTRRKNDAPTDTDSRHESLTVLDVRPNGVRKHRGYVGRGCSMTARRKPRRGPLFVRHWPTIAFSLAFPMESNIETKRYRPAITDSLNSGYLAVAVQRPGSYQPSRTTGRVLLTCSSFCDRRTKDGGSVY